MYSLRLVAFVVLLFANGPAFAKDQVVIADFSTAVDRPGLPAGWQLKERSGKGDVAFLRDDGIAAARLRSANTSFSLQKEVQVDLRKYPVLSWKWKVTKLPAAGDYRKAGSDDQAAQLFLAFSKTRGIVYLWDTSAPAGSAGDAAAPFFMSIKAIVVRSGPGDSGKWITENRNVLEDYRNLFNEEPGPVAGIRLQINSQHTRTSAESYFADIAFSGKQ
jgi:hypothetical protein